jgi:ubiquinone/menaquinone biosynthesis C-methylase UbiE
MTDIQPEDVPSPIDLQAASDARAWAESANLVRPWRTTFFEAIAEAIHPAKPVRVLELGSGPGFLAEQVLSRRPFVEMVLLDFSEPMHALARERLQNHSNRVQYVQRSFKEDHWMDGLGVFDHVVTNQAVHELRHKRYAGPLHEQVRSVLVPGGTYLVSDHYFGDDGMKKEGLYMTVEEQRRTLAAAGFTRVEELLRLGGMVLHSAA